MYHNLYENLSVLIVEDDEESARELFEVMSLYFTFVHLAKDGCDGLDLIDKYHPDIILADINMPCMNGIEMLEEAKKINTSSILIYTTAHNDTEYLLSAIDIKVDAYLIKPIELEALFEKIEKILKDRVIVNSGDINKPSSIPNSILLHKKLSKREYEVFVDIAKGLKPNSIAQKYEIKSKTVSTYRNRILEKMCINSNAEIIKYAISNSLI